MIEKFLTVLLTIILSSSAYAEIVGTGCGPREKALEFALSDLSSQIQVQVESVLHTTKRIANGKTDEFFSHKIKITTELPIFAYKETYENGCSTVSFDEKKANILYLSKLKESASSIDSLISTANKEKLDSIKLKYLNNALAAYNEYEKLEIVAIFLNIKEFSKPEYTKFYIEKEILKLQTVSSDISQITKNILSQLSQKSFKVSHVSLYDSPALPAFASILTKNLEATVPKGGDDTLRCEYYPSGDPFLISCQLQDKNGKVKEVANTSVSKKICDEIECFKSSYITDLTNNTFGTAQFHGYFYTNYGTEHFIYHTDDIIRFYARVSEPSEVALLISSLNDNNTYVLPIDNNLTKVIDKNMTNREQNIFTAKVTAPYGVERLTLIGYKGDLADIIKKLPIDNSTGMRKVDGKTMASFRAIDAGKYFESSITFTTEKK